MKSHETYKDLFETIKKRSMKKIYSEKPQMFKDDARKRR